MSKEMSLAELEVHVKRSIEQLSTLLEEWEKSGIPYHVDKAKKVAYWVRDYSGFLRREDAFNSSSVPKLKRGSVISVDFGFRIGKEFGGRHFAAVLDNDNSIYSHTVTVIPLFSLKEHYKPNKFTCELQDGIYTPMLVRTRAIIDEAMKILAELYEDKTEEYRSTPEARAKSAVAKELTMQANNMMKEIEHMKPGSVANTCQITTISKMRIKRPLIKADSLYGLRLSAEDMESINKQVSQLYIFSK